MSLQQPFFNEFAEMPRLPTSGSREKLIGHYQRLIDKGMRGKSRLLDRYFAMLSHFQEISDLREDALSSLLAGLSQFPDSQCLLGSMLHLLWFEFGREQQKNRVLEVLEKFKPESMRASERADFENFYLDLAKQETKPDEIWRLAQTIKQSLDSSKPSLFIGAWELDLST